MSVLAVKANRLTKEYRLGVRNHGMLYRDIQSAWARFRGRDDPNAPLNLSNPAKTRTRGDRFRALQDVSFEVEAGETLGIIGRNGAGKSTLLKILSRITKPTSGEVYLRGRVATLLEVGTGFHPELTGRENVFLNGTILGMARSEIYKKFDEIVAFAEIDQFIDTPVKRYSSGMYVRLAFAVAAHLEPDILIVDEVLAVGDAAFQRKCLGKMNSVAMDGRTILFVSHNMTAVQSLCKKAILLVDGQIVKSGETRDVTDHYLESEMNQSLTLLAHRQDRGGSGEARIHSLEITNADNAGQAIAIGSPLQIKLQYSGEKPLVHPQFLLSISDANGVGILALDSDAAGGLPDVLPATGTVSCKTGPLMITPGRCFVNVALLRGGALTDHVEYAAVLDVAPFDFYGTGKMPGRNWAMTVIDQNWRRDP